MSKDLPNGWVRTTLGEVCLPVETTQPSDWPQTKFTYIDIGSIDNEKNIIAEIRTVTGRSAPSRARQVVRKNDILFSTVRTYLSNVARLEEDYVNPIASTGFAVIRPAVGVSSLFLFFQLLSEDFLQPLHLLQSGSSYPAVRSRDIFAQPIVLPPTFEQERIAVRLDQAFRRITNGQNATRRALTRLERYQAQVLNAAYRGTLPLREVASDRPRTPVQQRESADTLLKRVLRNRESEWTGKGKYKEPAVPTTLKLPELPADWTWTSPDQLSQPTDDSISAGPFGTIFKARDFRQKGIPIIFLRHVGPGRYLTENPGFMDRKKWNQLFRPYSVFGGELLIAKLGDPPGMCAIYPEGIGPAMVTPDVIKFLVNEAAAVPKFLMHYFNSELGREFSSGVAFGTTRPRLTLRLFREMPVPLAPLYTQARIVEEIERRLNAAESFRSRLQTSLTNAAELRESLRRRALAGQLVSQSSDDEPASKLLLSIAEQQTHSQLEITESRRIRRRAKEQRGIVMQQPLPTPEVLRSAWRAIGQKTNARRLFDEAGFEPEHVVQFYEALRESPDVRKAFQEAAPKRPSKQKPVRLRAKAEKHSGHFRLVELWLEDFKNLKDYSIFFNPQQGLDIVLGWNGTGKSNLFEALVIIFRDLHEWGEKKRWRPLKPMAGFRIRYEVNEKAVQITWRPEEMKRPELRMGPIFRKSDAEPQLEAVKREELPLPRFVFGYYSGPTNRLAEHFLPMNQAHYHRLRTAKTDDPITLAELIEQRRFFCAETHHAKYVLLAFSYKEDPEISVFLRERLRILGFESALFVIRKPRWAVPGSRPNDFWGATGIMRRVMERLSRHAIAPMVLKQKVGDGYRRSAMEDHYYFFLPDIDSLHSFAAEYQDARTFFLALESIDFSELIHDVKIQVRVKASDSEQVSITFHQLSEGEQQLLMVLGLMRFTKSHQSLVLLDEPDTHLNPHWSIDYLKDLVRVMSDNAGNSSEQQTSQILLATHDPLVIASLIKEQIHLLKRDPITGACKWYPASIDPRGLGFTGILTSEMFGFRSDLDPETLADLDERVRLVGKEGTLTPKETKQLEAIDKRLDGVGILKAFSDPYYSAFVKAWGRRNSELMSGLQFLSPEQQEEVDQFASDVLEEAMSEIEQETKAS